MQMCLHCSPHYPYAHKDVHVVNKAKSKMEINSKLRVLGDWKVSFQVK